jgi:hypothetical protein
MSAPKQKPEIFLFCPTHDARMDHRTAARFFKNATTRPHIHMVGTNSLLAFNFNLAYASALNLRHEYPSLKWFVMLHSDIAPENWWVDKLIKVADEHGADLMSTVIPFKSPEGITSTAIAHEMDSMSVYARLTMKQVLALPKTFDIDTACEHLRSKVPTDLRLPDCPASVLLVNSGCMALRMDKTWSNQLHFTITDDIIVKNNRFEALVLSEDWHLSHQVANNGGKVFATTEVQATHLGNGMFSNDQPFGVYTDPQGIHAQGGTGIYNQAIAEQYGYPKSEALAHKLENVFDRKNFVIDLGCGDAFYILRLRSEDFNVVGVDGYISEALKNLAEHTANFTYIQTDLSKPVAGVTGQVLSLEVGEHIPVQFEQTFIDNLCRHCTSRMVISWALPGQHGVGHVNCRPNDYIIDQITKRGFKFNDDETDYLRNDIEPHVSYFAKTIMVFDKVTD